MTTQVNGNYLHFPSHFLSQNAYMWFLGCVVNRAAGKCVFTYVTTQSNGLCLYNQYLSHYTKAQRCITKSAAPPSHLFVSISSKTESKSREVSALFTRLVFTAGYDTVFGGVSVICPCCCVLKSLSLPQCGRKKHQAVNRQGATGNFIDLTG